MNLSGVDGNRECTRYAQPFYRRVARHRACVRGLGLRRVHHSVEVADTPENRGMINKVADMLAVEEA